MRLLQLFLLYLTIFTDEAWIIVDKRGILTKVDALGILSVYSSPEIKTHYLLIHMSFQTHMTYFLPSDTNGKENVP